MGRSRNYIKKNPRYTNRRYLCPYCTLRVSKSLDLRCVFDRLSNFEKCNLRSGHLMWPGGVTFGVIGSSFFFWKCTKLLAAQLWQIWRRYAPPFFRYSWKTWGGGWYPSPGRARVKTTLMLKCYWRDPRPSLYLLIRRRHMQSIKQVVTQCRLDKTVVGQVLTPFWEVRAHFRQPGLCCC